MKDSTARAIENLDTASEGVRLWVTYCERVGVDDDFHGRFKVRHSRALWLSVVADTFDGRGFCQAVGPMICYPTALVQTGVLVSPLTRDLTTPLSVHDYVVQGE